MELNELFKQLKDIEPDKDFSRRSLHLILNSAPKEASKPTIRAIFAKSAEFAAAIALAGLLIFLITGGSSNIPSPLQVANLDPATLRAEAHAIDMQIELVNLDYSLSTPPVASSSESTPSTALPLSNAAQIAPPADSSQASSSVSALTSTLSVDQALNELAK